MSEPMIHPLFDPCGLYRLASRESVWHDHGESSLRSYFAALNRQRLRTSWRPGTAPGEWGFGPKVNQWLHDFQQKVHEQSLQQATSDVEGSPWGAGDDPALVGAGAAAGVGHALASAGSLAPALLKFDLSGGGAPPVPTAIRDVKAGEGWFTNMGDPMASLFGPMRVTFEIEVPEVEIGRRCMVLLLLSSQVRDLARALGLSEWQPHDEAPALQAIAKALHPDLLEPPTPGEGFDTACRLASILALAPGYERTADPSFYKSVEVGGRYPSVQPGSYVVFCVGPKEEDLARVERLMERES